MLADSDVRTLAQSTKLTILNIEERFQYASVRYAYDAINIPLDELLVRANELDLSKLIVVDCTRLAEPTCSSAVEGLSGQGLKVVAMNESGTGSYLK